MDDKVVAPRQPRGRGKVKNEAEKGRDRPALLDIGNLDTQQIIQGKPCTNINRPITRGFRANLLVNAQKAAVENKRSVAAVADELLPVNRKGGNVKKGAFSNKKLYDKPNPDTIIDISCDDEEEIVKKKVGIEKQSSNEIKPEITIQINSNGETSFNPVSERSSSKGTARNNVRTLTSILTARSKDACGVNVMIAKESKDEVVNIDAGDVNDELSAAEYVDDLYKLYKATENDTPIQNYLCSQPLINARMRKILVDWLIQVQSSFQLTPETLFLTVNILDRYLSLKVVSKYELQLVGLGSMLIACKYEEVWPPQVKDLVCISDKAYVEEQVLAMEKEILEKLEWYLTVPTPYMFLVRYVKASVSPDSEMENMVFFLAELGLAHYDTVVSYSPSMIAAAAVYAARCTLNRSPLWSATLNHHTGYTEEQLMNCTKQLVGFPMMAAKVRELSGIYSKFASPGRDSVALLPPAIGLHRQL